MEDGSEWNLWLQAYSQSETWKYIFIIWIILLLIAALVIQVNWKKKQNVHSSEVKKQTDNSVCERNDDISPVVCFLKIAGEDIRRILNSRKSSEETKPNTEKKTRCEEENEWSFSKFYMEYRKEHPYKEKTSPVSKPTEEAVIVKDEVQRPMKNRTGTLE